MSRTPVIWTVAALAVLAVQPAAAQLTVATDAPAYDMGDTVVVTTHNAGPGDAEFVSYPPCVIWHIDTDTCVYGCTGLPVVWPLHEGETETVLHDTGQFADPPGMYRVRLVGGSSVPGSILETDYELRQEVDADAAAWGRVKALYR
jgi:hypothetical protein